MLQQRLRKGDRVTRERPTYFDSDHIRPGWPNEYYVGTVTKIEEIYGLHYATVRFDKKGIPNRRVLVTDLFLVSEPGAPRAMV